MRSSLVFATTFLSILPLSLSITPTIVNDTGEYYITDASQNFTDQSIQCSSPNCYVICDNSCSHTQIDASASSSLTIECNSEHSCDWAHLTNGPTDNITIKCSTAGACYNAEFNADTTNHVQIDCINRNGGFTYSKQCDFTTLNAVHSQSVQVSCIGDQACWNVVIDVEYAQSVSIVANGSHALSYVDVHASNAASLDITCTPAPGQRNSDETYACNSGEWYIPSPGFSLNCYGKGCFWLADIFVAEGIENDTFTDIYFNGCGECDAFNGDDCMPALNKVHCFGNSTDDWSQSDAFNNLDNGGFCDTNHCGCEILLAELQNAYIDEPSDCAYEYVPYDFTKLVKTLLWIIFGVVGAVVAVCICVIVTIYCLCFIGNKRRNQDNALLAEVSANVGGVTVDDPNEPPTKSKGYVPPTTVTDVQQQTIGDNPVRYNL